MWWWIDRYFKYIYDNNNTHTHICTWKKGPKIKSGKKFLVLTAYAFATSFMYIQQTDDPLMYIII